MAATAPFAPWSAHYPWVVAETSQSALEVLGIVTAVIGVLLWVVGLLWLVLSDVLRAAHHSRKHDAAGPGRDSEHS